MSTDNGTTYGYARCSTDETRQDIDRQRRDLLKMGVTDTQHIYWEYASGTKADKPELQKLLTLVQPGDTIAATEVSRLTRSEKQLCDILQEVKDRHLRLLIGSFVVDCRADDPDPMTKGMLLMWGVFAEMERDMISQRVKSGMQNARAKGKPLGRPKVTKNDIPAAFYKCYALYKDGKVTVADCAKMLGRSRTTVYKYIAMVEDNE